MDLPFPIIPKIWLETSNPAQMQEKTEEARQPACLQAAGRTVCGHSIPGSAGVYATTLGRMEKGQTQKISGDVLADTSENRF